MRNDLSGAVDRYTKAAMESLLPPTREEIDILRLDVVRSALVALIVEEMSVIAEEKRRINQRERTLGKIKAALDLTAPLQDISG